MGLEIARRREASIYSRQIECQWKILKILKFLALGTAPRLMWSNCRLQLGKWNGDGRREGIPKLNHNEFTWCADWLRISLGNVAHEEGFEVAEFHDQSCIPQMSLWMRCGNLELFPWIGMVLRWIYFISAEIQQGELRAQLLAPLLLLILPKLIGIGEKSPQISSPSSFPGAISISGGGGDGLKCGTVNEQPASFMMAVLQNSYFSLSLFLYQ